MRPFAALSICVLLAMTSCQKDEPCLTCPTAASRIVIDTLLVEPTEIDLRISTRDSTSLGAVAVRRDTVTIFKSDVRSADTVIVDDSVLPGRIYTYRVSVASHAGPSILDSFNTITIHTMDTTSHEFNWEVDTIGDGNASVLFDVAIVSDTVAYAVGEIYVMDSAGNYNSDPFNVLTFDRSSWKVKSITYVPLRAVFTPSESDIWAGSSAPYRWDGYSWRVFNVSGIFNGYISRFWGTDSRNLFMVGTNGSIAHFSGTSWQRMVSETDIDLTDVSGTNAANVWAGGVDLATGQRSVVLRLDGTNWRTIYTYDPAHAYEQRPDSVTGIVTSLYAQSEYRVWLNTSSGVYRCPGNTTGQGTLSWAPGYLAGLPWAIRGDAANNIFIAGDFGTIAHYNGKTWHHFRQFMDLYGNSAPNFNSIAVRGREVMIVGSLPTGKAIVYRGRRIM